MFARPKESTPVQKEVKAKEDTSSDSEDKMATINKNLAFNKRKPDLLMDGGEVVEKRKKGRPRKDKMAAPVSQTFIQVQRRHPFLNIYLNLCDLKNFFLFIIIIVRWEIQLNYGADLVKGPLCVCGLETQLQISRQR